MCGIFAVIGKKSAEEAQKLSIRMSHRGPDERDVHVNEAGYVLCHERLSIIDLHTGKQPISGSDKAWMIHNGEIYNHKQLREELGALGHKFHTTSDSEVIVHLYEQYGNDFCNKLDGVFAFVVVDGDNFIAGRDPIGVKPMYYGKDTEGNLYFSSEMKSLADQCVDFEAFPPGHYYSKNEGLVKYYNPEWADYKVCTKDVDLKELREALEAATRKRLMSDVPLGVLLSGGLDSSLTSAIVKREADKTGQKIHSFSIGLDETAPDLIAAKEVADFIGTEHHAIHFSVEQGIKIIEKLVWHLETYDITSIRASTPMYFLSEAITKLGIKVVLSGEGADEIFGGYLYFHNVPSREEFTKECIDRVFKLSTADVLRADKSTMAHGLEARVPFLDRHFLDVAMKIKAEDKEPNRATGKAEKYILRKAFDTPDNPYLPERILWRQKEQFSDGVGYNWIDDLIAHCEAQVSDEDFAKAEELYPINPPKTKEAFFMRRIFHKHFPQEAAAKTVKKWIPKWQKNEDPSGRANESHEKANVEIGTAKKA